MKEKNPFAFGNIAWIIVLAILFVCGFVSFVVINFDFKTPKHDNSYITTSEKSQNSLDIPKDHYSYCEFLCLSINHDVIYTGIYVSTIFHGKPTQFKNEIVCYHDIEYYPEEITNSLGEIEVFYFKKGSKLSTRKWNKHEPN